MRPIWAALPIIGRWVRDRYDGFSIVALGEGRERVGSNSGPILAAVRDKAAPRLAAGRKGAKPADLPVEGAKSFNLAVNLKTAKALGVTIPDSILKQAVDVIK